MVTSPNGTGKGTTALDRNGAGRATVDPARAVRLWPIGIFDVIMRPRDDASPEEVP
jgi:hypothetical protein